MNSADSRGRRIDVHHHFLPPDFVAELRCRDVAWTGGPDVPEWNVSIALETMARNGIETAVASVVPQTYWGDTAAAARWARSNNEFLARAVADDRRHFGGLASLPLPDTQASCRELVHAFEELNLDGVILMASSGNQYLGDPQFEELFQELDRRSAVVLIHPNTVPPGSDVPRLSLPYALVEFVFDTTRCIANLLYHGVFERYPSIRYIVSHAGGAVPYLAARIALGEAHPDLRRQAPKGTAHYLRRLYYDTALSTSEPQLAALRAFVPASQILFGSDFPLASEAIVKAEISDLDSSRHVDRATLNAIQRQNALALFPRFSAG